MTAPGGKAWRPCCGTCRFTTLSQPVPDADIACIHCGAIWDGSEVSRDKLPAIIEEQIAAGFCTRDQAYVSFLVLDDLAGAAAKGEITFGQGAELVVQQALKTIGKARPQ